MKLAVLGLVAPVRGGVAGTEFLLEGGLGLGRPALRCQEREKTGAPEPGEPASPPDSKQILGRAPSTRPAHLKAYRIWAGCSGLPQEVTQCQKNPISTGRRSSPIWSGSL